MADALRARGADDTTARLAAEMGVLALTTAFARWAKPDNRRPYTEIAHAVRRSSRKNCSSSAADGSCGNRP
jgi:hypothetical protein